MRKPPEPHLAPAGADDKALAIERVEIAAWGRKLERKVELLSCYILKKPHPCRPDHKAVVAP